ncbi:hypothetical protein G7Y89_g14516 [Cudoniella acicularis]|uniref:SUZ-C domain-containing protein n=1 Tax=Cudoniella acicularis TaxID=354080 RepID=A0A8H4VV84_9HELO|nr:hypothetical protein G7Y89_g14516 [Cudoniella acicularis]
MSKKAAVPDAWDDDWESQADKEDREPEVPVQEEVKVSKKERLARHAETNKKIWESAEEPETFHFLAARDDVPLKTEFKPTLKVLSRKPTPKAIQKVDPVTGLAKLTLEDDEDDEEEKKEQLTPEELALKKQKMLQERQKRYEETRARIMGSPSGGSSGTTTPPTSTGDGKGHKGKGRGRDNTRHENRRPGSQSGPKELYDPNYTPKPGVSIQKRNGENSQSGRSTPRDDDQIIRAPKGPDGSGRGGFGFARGGKKS